MKLTQSRLREVMQYDELTGAFTWRITSRNAQEGAAAGSLNRGYLMIGVDGRRYSAHRLAWLYVHGSFPDEQIDHVNGNRADNRIANLRAASRFLNAQNVRRARRDNTTGLLGVRQRENAYEARIQVNGSSIYIGRFNTPEAAHAAYLNAKRRLHAGCTI